MANSDETLTKHVAKQVGGAILSSQLLKGIAGTGLEQF